MGRGGKFGKSFEGKQDEGKKDEGSTRSTGGSAEYFYFSEEFV